MNETPLTLNTLPEHAGVILQCHDNPDADTIASAYALYRYFTSLGEPAKMVYAGFNSIKKPNLTIFADELSMPLEFLGKQTPSAQELLPGDPLLITVDCQHGAGNVTRIEADKVCVIDHHIKETNEYISADIKAYLGSCATLVWTLLKDIGWNLDDHEGVSTALYYGLYMDTNNLAEMFHPVDRDMLDHLHFDTRFIKKLKGVNLTKEELVIAGRALGDVHYFDEIGNVMFEVEQCDPNILGFISDMTQQVDGVTTCVGFSEINGGVKLSLRSSTNEVMANEMAAYLTQGVGSGGGTRDKAGGFLKCPEDAGAARDFLAGRIQDYFRTYDKIVSGVDALDTSAMKTYRKKPVTVAYVEMSEVFPPGSAISVRTMEGDADFQITDDTLLMIGIQGETYPISRKTFDSTYEKLDGTFEFSPLISDADFYTPTAHDKLYGKQFPLMEYAKPCVPTGESYIYAAPLERDTKIFASWYPDGYMFGKPGDYVAVRYDKPLSSYIIDNKIFAYSYEEVSNADVVK
ncbi:MAG: DHH family phosphoesterase [Clostridiales Family XIII bacterium]|jgi:phosphoglycolate phosphatase|nr:DHH family phosphoesterase [Clostridiales Family XIII bacterium]